MSDLIQIGKVVDLTPGTMKEVLAQGREILLARVGDKYYAADGRCPHMRGRLAQGKLVGTVVTCPLHGSQFDLTDGRVVSWTKGGLYATFAKRFKSPRPLVTYPVKIDGDKIMVEI